MPRSRKFVCDLHATGAGPEGIDALKQHPFFDGVRWETLLDDEAPTFAPPPAPNQEDEAFDWDLSTLASNGPVKYEYVPTGAPELVTQHSTASSSSASSGDVSPRKAAEPRGSRFGQQHVGAVSRLSSVAAALDASSVDDLQQEITHLQLAEPRPSGADGGMEMSDQAEQKRQGAAAADSV